MGTVTQKIVGLFCPGRLPATLRARLETEGRILCLAEGIAETAVFKDFRAPGAHCSHRCTGFTGFFVITEKRIVVKAAFFNQINVNVAYDDPQFRSIAFTATPELLSLAFDASVQSPQMSGQVEVRLHLPDVSTTTAILLKIGARIELKHG
jgi:hypothetical protein